MKTIIDIDKKQIIVEDNEFLSLTKVLDICENLKKNSRILSIRKVPKHSKNEEWWTVITENEEKN